MPCGLINLTSLTHTGIMYIVQHAKTTPRHECADKLRLETCPRIARENVRFKPTTNKPCSSSTRRLVGASSFCGIISQFNFNEAPYTVRSGYKPALKHSPTQPKSARDHAQPHDESSARSVDLRSNEHKLRVEKHVQHHLPSLPAPDYQHQTTFSLVDRLNNSPT